MRKFSTQVSALAFLSGLVLASPVMAQTSTQARSVAGALTTHLTLAGVYADASLIMKAVLWGLTLSVVAALVVWLTQVVRSVQGRSEGVQSAVTYLSAQAAAAPLFGAFGLAYAVLSGCIGIANVQPTPNLTVLAPGLAEAFLSLGLGLLAGAIATVGQSHLRARLASVPKSHAAPASASTTARVAA